MNKIPRVVIFWVGLLTMGVFLVESRAEVDWTIKAPKALEDSDTVKKAQEAASTKEEEEIMRPKIGYDAQGLRDPFRPLVAEKKNETVVASRPVEVKPLPALTVQGLVWGGSFPQAIINNKVVRIGDVIEEAKITGIEKDGVTVIFANREHKLASTVVAGPQQKEKK